MAVCGQIKLKINITLTNDKGEQFVGDVELTKTSVKKQGTTIKTKPKKTIEDKSKPPYSISNLYNNGFFKTAKKLRDVNSTLKTNGFNFKAGSIQYALDHADFLDRKGNTGNYKWIQKYPPS